MTNKEKYINSFSGVEPSDKIKERIFSMTEPKRRTPLRVVAVIAVVIATMMLAMLTANAAADGEIVEKISEAGKAFVVLLNGETVRAKVDKTVITDENGNEIANVSIEIPSLEGSETPDEILISYSTVELEEGNDVLMGEINVSAQNGDDSETAQNVIVSDYDVIE